MRHVISSIQESISSLLGKGDPLLPPRRLIEAAGGGDFDQIGQEFFRHFRRIGGLKPHHRVLDVGCGCGRMAVPMIPFLADAGEYRGFDIAPGAIHWAKKHIAARYPRFHFDLADIRNLAYNPKGKGEAHEYRFPYESNFFDFAFLTSVFTHMMARDMRHYLDEISRTLKPGGRCLINYFLLNPVSLEKTRKGESRLSFPHPLPECFATDEDKPDAAIAYDENFVRSSLAKAGLSIVEPIHYGCWSGRKPFLSFEDIVLAVKTGAR